ncbi:MAG: HK97 gp10 family phage protein [Clostridia bacterium]|nr:HK97 gp10 family phage protein [Clostridia bacterium]
MARLYFRTTGFKELINRLDRMENAMEKKQELMKEVGEYCKTEIRALAPKDTGALQNAIDYKLVGDDAVEVGVMHSIKNNGRSTLIYGTYQEFGTHKMSSNSYMRVFWENRAEIQEMILDRILNLLAVA